MTTETPFIELSWREAEARFDRRLDRRRRYSVYDGDEQTLLVLAHWTQHCTGCTEVGDYCRAPEAGCGCDECGYTGRRRCSMWLEDNYCPDSSTAAGRRKRELADARSNLLGCMAMRHLAELEHFARSW